MTDKMKLNGLSFYIILVSSLMIAGCLNYSQETQLNRDGSGNMKLSYSFPAGSQQGRELSQQLDTAEIRKQVQDTLFTINKISTKTGEGGAWSVQLEIGFKSIEALNNTRLFNMFDISFQDGAPGQKKFLQFIRPSSERPDPRIEFTRTFIFEFDGEVITHNAHKVDGSKYIWVFKFNDIGDGKYIEATFAPQEPNYIVFYILGALVVVAGLGFFMLKRRKTKPVIE